MNEDSESSMQERSLVSREYEAAMSSTSSQLSVYWECMSSHHILTLEWQCLWGMAVKRTVAYFLLR
jgi:hypothetical protein